MMQAFSDDINKDLNVFQGKSKQENLSREIMLLRSQSSFEQASKDIVEMLGPYHPNGIRAFARGLDRGLKYGYKPADIEILFRTWYRPDRSDPHYISDPEQIKMLKITWPELRNDIDSALKPYSGKTFYSKNMPPYTKGISDIDYSESNVIPYGEFYHRDIGWY